MGVVHDFTTTKGDTYNGAVYTVTVNGAAPASALARVRRQFRKSYPGPVVLEWDTAAKGGMAIVDAAGGVYEANSQIIDIPAGAYVYDDEITFANSTVKTYVSGTMTVAQDITE